MDVNLKKPCGSSRHFAFPHEVVEDPSLSIAEKRAILSEWASDASAVESFPTLRLLRGTSFPVTFSAVMDARDQLDRKIAEPLPSEDEPLQRLVVAEFAKRRRDNSVER